MPEQHRRFRGRLLRLAVGYLAGWVVGVLIAGTIHEQLRRAHGHTADAGVSLIVAACIVLEAPALVWLRANLGPRRITVPFGFCFGAVSGPLVLGLLYLLA